MTTRRRQGDVPRRDRRRFLGQASCAAVGTTALFNTILNLRMFNALAAPTDDYRALVCLFLSGGIDSYNVLVPLGDAEHQEYAAVRGDLALPQNVLLPITPATPDGKTYGLHPGLPELQALFAAGQLGLVANLGTLAEPTTLDAYRRGTANLPVGLFSHSDQQMAWQSGIPDQRSPIGWAGRMADVMDSGNCDPNIGMNISLSGNNIWQSGRMTSHYTISENGAVPLWDYRGTSPSAMVRTDAVDSLLALQYRHLFEKVFAAKMRGAIDAQVDFSNALASIPPLQTQFSNTSLSRKFRMIAMTIAAREALCMKRQTFFIDWGGWDMHDEVILNQSTMLPIVSHALSEFHAALVELGVSDAVTTFTASDFGRTLTSNGRGSDHAWGGNHIVMGPAIPGGDLYGSYPSLYAGNDLDTGRGRLIPTTSVDEYFAQLAVWFGVSTADLDVILPNIGRFWTPGSSTPPLLAGTALTAGRSA
ncbi:MAG TPA: DUF1501 domain-containing protein [Candidatus Polarisedimenticolaceae bacterium]|nr:DUF1501 domain-containing protein [Candidatus Polarisedimenticolaceae bacterium]